MTDPGEGARRGLVLRVGDGVATAIAAGILLGGLFGSAYAALDWTRTAAWIGCAVLGCWSAIGWAVGRWDGPRMATARWLLLLLGLAVLFSTVHVLPLSRSMVSDLSPIWKDIFDSFDRASVPAPDSARLALAPERAWQGIAQLIAAMLFYAGVVLLANHRGNTRFLVIALCLTCLVEGFVGLFHYLVGEAPRAFASVYNPNHFAVAVIIGLPLYFAGLMEWKKQSPSLSEDVLGGKNPLLLLAGLGIIAGLGWLTSLSRSSVFITCFVLLLWLMGEILAWRRSVDRGGGSMMTVLVGGILLLLVLFVGSVFLEGFLERLFSGDTMTANSRVRIWKASLHGLSESNGLGVGLGGTEYMINRYANYPLGAVPIWAHNDYLQWVCDLGAGAALCLGIVGLLALRSFVGLLHRRRESFSWSKGFLHRASLVGIAIALLHAFVDFHLRIPLVGFMVLTLIALCLQSGIFKLARTG